MPHRAVDHDAPVPDIVGRISEPGEPMLRRVIWLLNAVFARLTRRDWRGLDQLPSTGGVIIVANHISHADPIALGQFVAAAGRWPRFLAKESLFTMPVIGWVVRRCGQIPVRRGSSTAAHSLALVVEAVQAGRAVIIYPEGTITRQPDLWPMAGKTGAARVALATGAPVIPIGQWGAQEIWWGNRLGWPNLFPRKTMRLRVGAPVRLDDLRLDHDHGTDAQRYQLATARIMAAITALVGDLRGQTPPTEQLMPSEDQP